LMWEFWVLIWQGVREREIGLKGSLGGTCRMYNEQRSVNSVVNI